MQVEKTKRLADEMKNKWLRADISWVDHKKKEADLDLIKISMEKSYSVLYAAPDRRNANLAV